MRFGTFVFSLSSDPTQDHQVIAQTLREVELAEAIGMDAVWLTEHHRRDWAWLSLQRL